MGKFVIDEVDLPAANGALDEFVRVKRRLADVRTKSTNQ